jgi:hypothetical protein
LERLSVAIQPAGSSARYAYQYRRAFLLQIMMHLAEKPCCTPFSDLVS